MSVASTNTRKYGAVTLGTLMPWIVCALILLILPQVLDSRGQLTIMSQMSIMIVFALAYNMLLGQGGMLSFGHAVYVGMGSFLCLHVMNSSGFGSIPLPILPLIGGLFGLGFAMIIGSFSTRSAGTVFAMITLGIGELMAACVLIIVVFFGGEEGISGYRDEGLPFFGLDFISHIEVFYLIAFWLFTSAALMFLFSRTPVGRMANAVRDNPERAQFLGYSSRWVRYVSFSASGFFCGIAGGLSAILFEIATESDLNVAASGVILLIVFLGGVGVFWGPSDRCHRFHPAANGSRVSNPPLGTLCRCDLCGHGDVLPGWHSGADRRPRRRDVARQTKPADTTLPHLRSTRHHRRSWPVWSDRNDLPRARSANRGI